MRSLKTGVAGQDEVVKTVMWSTFTGNEVESGIGASYTGFPNQSMPFINPRSSNTEAITSNLVIAPGVREL